MRLAKLATNSIHDLIALNALGQCVLVDGPLHAPAQLEELPAGNLPAVILCDGCDSYLERLLNERGVAVTRALDPVQTLAPGAEVRVDLLAGVLGDLASGREFALVALPKKLVEALHA